MVQMDSNLSASYVTDNLQGRELMGAPINLGFIVRFVKCKIVFEARFSGSQNTTVLVEAHA